MVSQSYYLLYDLACNLCIALKFSLLFFALSSIYGYVWLKETVDGRDPAPPWMVQTCSNPRNNENHLPTGSWGDGEVYQLQDFATIRRIYFTGNLTVCY